MEIFALMNTRFAVTALQHNAQQSPENCTLYTYMVGLRNIDSSMGNRKCCVVFELCITVADI